MDIAVVQIIEGNTVLFDDSNDVYKFGWLVVLMQVKISH